MSQQINDNFQRLFGSPIDNDYLKTTIGDRDVIPSTLRHVGMLCYVSQTSTLYQLQGGIDNTNWVGIAGQNVALGFEVSIDGFLALVAGKTELVAWEVGDKFRGWISSRYVVGEILSLPVSLPSDIDNISKVKLAVDSNNISPYVAPVSFTVLSTGTGQEFTLPVGATAKAVYKSRGLLYRDTEWSQSDTTLTIIVSANTGNTIYVEF